MLGHSIQLFVSGKYYFSLPQLLLPRVFCFSSVIVFCNAYPFKHTQKLSFQLGVVFSWLPVSEKKKYNCGIQRCQPGYSFTRGHARNLPCSTSAVLQRCHPRTCTSVRLLPPVFFFCSSSVAAAPSFQLSAAPPRGE